MDQQTIITVLKELAKLPQATLVQVSSTELKKEKNKAVMCHHGQHQAH